MTASFDEVSTTALAGDVVRHAIARPLVAWLRQSALPLWSTAGVDRVRGGFFEKLDAHALPIEEPRRTRVVARQIYVFATAARRGWLPAADELVDHGLAFLLERLRLPDGTYAASVRPDGTVVDGRFDLYEQAFVLFALATATDRRPERAPALRGAAEDLLATLRARWSHPLAGFEESAPRTTPLRSNPHMHLLEAALAWQERSSGPAAVVWSALVDELVDLCVTRFCDSGSGAVREHFDADWRAMPEERGTIVEPGHQFEWAWLLARVGRRNGRADLRAAAARLLDIGETHGVDRLRNVACDALDDAFRVIDDHAKVWPQTERLKAWNLMVELGVDDDARMWAERGLERAVRGLRPYLRTWPAGLWHEQMRRDGGFVPTTCRASSLYHIVCAIDAVAPGDASASAASAASAPSAPSIR